MIYVVLPAFNEELNIGPIFDGLEELSQRIGEIRPILVDDGSSDATAEKARTLGAKVNIRVIQHEKNKGLGAAVMTGLEAVCAEASDNDIVVLLDADNSHNPNHIIGMVNLINEGKDIVIASRYAPGGKEVGLSTVRSIGSRTISLMLASIFQVDDARDYTCGYRAYRVGMIKKGFSIYGDKLISETSFVCMAELLVKLNSVGAKVAEFPLVLRYDLKQGESKMNIPRTLRRYLHLVVTQAPTIHQIRGQQRVRMH
jgi:dolichol-phosphate mannosyltransferase